MKTFRFEISRIATTVYTPYNLFQFVFVFSRLSHVLRIEAQLRITPVNEQKIVYSKTRL